MLCLMESQLMRGIIDANFDSLEAKSIKIIKQHDNLLKGWIYGSLNEEARHKTKLRKATEKGCWREAKCILKNKKDAATEVISRNGNTMIHLTVVKGHNCFLEKLLNLMENKSKRKIQMAAQSCTLLQSLTIHM
ncbi:hypothetical protein Tco_0396558 [Tanacetum coccineum]